MRDTRSHHPSRNPHAADTRHTVQMADRAIGGARDGTFTYNVAELGAQRFEEARRDRKLHVVREQIRVTGGVGYPPLHYSHAKRSTLAISVGGFPKGEGFPSAWDVFQASFNRRGSAITEIIACSTLPKSSIYGKRNLVFRKEGLPGAGGLSPGNFFIRRCRCPR